MGEDMGLFSRAPEDFGSFSLLAAKPIGSLRRLIAYRQINIFKGVKL